MAVCSVLATASRSASEARSLPGSNDSVGSSVTLSMVVRQTSGSPRRSNDALLHGRTAVDPAGTGNRIFPEPPNKPSTKERSPGHRHRGKLVGDGSDSGCKPGSPGVGAGVEPHLTDQPVTARHPAQDHPSPD